MMSGQPQRVRRNGSPSTKQGPIKATVPFPLMTGSPTRGASCSKKCSPSSSPTGEHRNKSRRRSPESRASPERTSPISPCFNKVEKPKPVKLSAAPNAMHRTRSLENFAAPATAYLTGQWPRDLAICLPTIPSFTSDKSTQTPDDWEQDNSDKRKKNHKRSSSYGGTNEALIEVKYHRIKQRLQRSKEGSKQNANSRERQSPIPGDHNALGSQQVTVLKQAKTGPIPINIPKTVGPRFRGSVEGFNPEIERLFPGKILIFGTEEEAEKGHEWVPDGHRAPVAELLQVSNTRSIDTQTPSSSLTLDECPITFQDEIRGSSTCSSSGGSISSSRAASESPTYIPGQMETDSPQIPERKEEKMDLDDQCKFSTSPLNQSFRRYPPDGCEKVKTVEEVRKIPPMKDPLLFSPVKPGTYCIPSVGSAFCPLYKSYVSQVTGTSNSTMRNSPVETQ